MIPFLQQGAVVDHGWLTACQFVGLALGVFLPAFVLPIFFHRWLVAVAENERIHAFLVGIAAGVIGLIAAVTVDIVETGVVDVWTGILAAAAFLALLRWHGKLTVLYMVLGCGRCGAALQASVV